MASATAEQHRDGEEDRHLLYTECLPLIDLRLLSQSELLSLSLCSSSPSFASNSDADLSTPKIDRSVFNESAGSRKQTFSRFRLLSSPVPSRTPPPPLCDDEEKHFIVSLLKRLVFSSSSSSSSSSRDSLTDGSLNSYGNVAFSDDNLVSVPIEYREDLVLPFPSITPPPNAALQAVPIGIVEPAPNNCVSTGAAVDPGSLVRKRKRGRPRKNENGGVKGSLTIESDDCVVHESKAVGVCLNKEEKEMVMVNKSGLIVDLAALAGVEDPFGEEFRRRTQGMETEAELLGFLNAMQGEWGSRRRKRKILDACEFGDALPIGWKLMLCVKKKAGRVWLACRRYIRYFSGH